MGRTPTASNAPTARGSGARLRPAPPFDGGGVEPLIESTVQEPDIRTIRFTLYRNLPLPSEARGLARRGELARTPRKTQKHNLLGSQLETEHEETSHESGPLKQGLGGYCR